MKISLLKKREDFDEIFKATLSKYLVNIYDWDGVISNTGEQSERYFINAKLNVIFNKSVSKEALQTVVKEFEYHPDFVTRSLQVLYIRLAISSVLRRVFCSSYIYIRGCPKDFLNTIILPGNHSIRLVKYKSCVVIKKEGFNSNFLWADCDARTKYHFLNIPKILKVERFEDWYEEERVFGLPLNRIADEYDAKGYEKQALSQLELLYDETKSFTTCLEYFESLKLELLELASLKALISENQEMIEILSLLEKNIFDLVDQTTNIIISTSHGDFQPANILCDGDEIKIIDWEYCSTRIYVYDLLVLKVGGRQLDGYGDRLKKFFNKNNNNAEKKHWFEKIETHYFSLFIANELLIRLKEYSSIPDFSDTSDLKLWLVQYRGVAEWLNRSATFEP